MEQKTFATSDIWLSAALTILLGCFPDFHVNNGKVFFVFPGDDTTYKAIGAFNNGVQLNVFLYSETVKKIRSEMYNRRAGATQ